MSINKNNHHHPDTFDTFSSGPTDSFATPPLASSSNIVPNTFTPEKSSPSRKLKFKSIYISHAQKSDLIAFIFTLLAFFLMLFALVASSSNAVRGVYYVELRLTDQKALANVTQGGVTWIQFGFYGYCYGKNELEFIDCASGSGLTVEPFDPLPIMQNYFPQVVTNLTITWINPSHNSGITFTIYLILVLALSAIALSVCQNILGFYYDKHYTRGFLLALAFSANTLTLGLAIHLYTDGLRLIYEMYPQFTGSFGNGLWFIGIATFVNLAASILFFRGCCTSTIL
ncbi:6338_t:CDS:2 [Ambispora leptoticha]|uniref:6338_t:CDS:1 n=1 Tax=Ambispora leptoticha TaxID=144679 RepID=A0A9N9CKI5_9GLOM|nr:6338_t:CDS:2 [Ambispora leptoticha]